MKSFHLSTEANLDIEEIANYIFDLNPVAAYRFLAISMTHLISSPIFLSSADCDRIWERT
jgi:hypothetical protein